MRVVTATVTRGGRITLPAEVRRALGVTAHDKIAFLIEDGGVRLSPATFTLESAYRSVAPLDSDIDIDHQIRLAKEERARRYEQKSSVQ